MAIQLPNNKISRTLPEQVGFNTQKIEEIIKAINDLAPDEKVIDLYSASGFLTNTQFEIAELSPSFILYSGKVFVKACEDGTNIDFIEVGALVGGSTTLTLSVERFRITVSTKAYQYAVIQLFESYTKAQIDSLLALKANLSGANFTGPITATSITELMDGYSFTKESALSNLIYVGISKTGNKITFVVYGYYNNEDTLNENDSIGYFTIPSSIGEKLYPETISGANVLDLKEVVVMQSINPVLNKKFNMYTVKINNSKISIAQYGANSLSLSFKGRFRYEVTFLLSNNLAQ